MGKFAKGCLIISGIFIAIGIVVGIMVTVIGGRSFLTLVNEQDETWISNRIFSDHTYRVYHNDWGWDFWNDFRNDLMVNNEVMGNRSFNGEIDSMEIDTLDIAVGAGEFELLEWNENNFRIEISGKGQCDYYVREGTLYIEGFKKIKRNANNNKIILYIPAGINYDYVNLEVGAGQSDIEGIHADRMECSVGMGAAHFTNMDVKKLDLEVGMGESIFEGRVKGDVSVTCGMGSITMLLEGSREDYNYSLSCAAGSISLGNESFSMLAGEKDIQNGADDYINLECAMGSIDINFNK